MFPAYCKAILKAMDGDIREKGQAKIFLKEQYVEFTSQFVPLLKMDSEAKIICLEGGASTHIITGIVYLSTQNFLRLINVKCKLLPGAENVLETPTYLKAEIFKPFIKKKFFKGNKIAHKWEECTVMSLSLDRISIRASRIMCEYENTIKLRMGTPVFAETTELTLTLSQNGLMFGKNSKYVYHISEIPEDKKEELADFVKLCSLELIKYLQ